MDLQIKGLRVLVTAGANGIGRATARAFAAEGARVNICDVDREALAAMASSDPAITQSVCDVSDRGAVENLFKEALAALGGLDCLVNNAGIAGPTGRVDEIDPADWDACVAVDLTGQYNCTRLAVQHLKQSANASIVNLSSQAGKHGFPLRSPYGAAKWGVIGFSLAATVLTVPTAIASWLWIERPVMRRVRRKDHNDTRPGPAASPAAAIAAAPGPVLTPAESTQPPS